MWDKSYKKDRFSKQCEKSETKSCSKQNRFFNGEIGPRPERKRRYIFRFL